MKVIDNKYKIGQRVWYIREEFEDEICPHCGNVDYRHAEYYPDSAEIKEIKAPAGEIIYWIDSFEIIKEDELFPTESEAQARCDELNKEDNK